MKIKFLKPFRLYNPIGDDMMMDEGTIENMEKEDYAEWLIDNGFAEKVKESGWWKPRLGERYYYFGSDGEVYNNQWENDSLDNARLKLGSVFKTEEATERYRDYMEAIAIVRQDKGFMVPYKTSDKIVYGFGIYCDWNGVIRAERSDHQTVAGEFYFDTHEHAKASVEDHQPEWQTILNYDWSKGEEEEDEN